MNGPARDEIEKDQHFHAPCSNIIYYHAHLFAISLHRNDSQDDVHKILAITVGGYVEAFDNLPHRANSC